MDARPVSQEALKLSREVDECKPLPVTPPGTSTRTHNPTRNLLPSFSCDIPPTAACGDGGEATRSPRLHEAPAHHLPRRDVRGEGQHRCSRTEL